MSVTGAVRAAGLPTGGDDRPTPVIDGVKPHRPARVLVVEPVRHVPQIFRRLAGVASACPGQSTGTALFDDGTHRVLECAGSWRLVACSYATYRDSDTCPTVRHNTVFSDIHRLTTPSCKNNYSSFTRSVNGSTGELHPYRGSRGQDVFASESDALEALYAEGRIQATLAGRAVLGLAPLPAAGVALLLIATRVRAAVTLPGGHDVQSVSEAVWVKVPVHVQAPPAPSSPGESAESAESPGGEVPATSAASPRPTRHDAETPSAQIRPAGAAAAVALGNALLEYPVEGCHFYCHTADVTRPWPWGGPHTNSIGLDSAEPEFTWNSWLAQPFAAAGCSAVCPPLVQGLAECRLMTDAKGARACVALIARRSCLHPGTRYLARGLNDAASPGNEVECEQLLFRVADPLGAAALQTLTLGDQPVGGTPLTQQQQQQRRVSQPGQPGRNAWCSVVWRRGTVPIRWGTEITSTVGEAELYVSARDPYNGTAAYFTRLCDTYSRRRGLCRSSGSSMNGNGDAAAPPAVDETGEAVSAAEEAPPDGTFTVTCVNLLRSSLRAPELLLTEHFHEGVRSARKLQPTQLGGIRVLNFDWHGNIKALGEAAAVEGLWSQLHAACASCGLSTGWDGDAPPSNAAQTPPAGREVTTWQRGMLRYNCADSLDRTNLASFFGAMQLLLEQAHMLGLSLENNAGGVTGARTQTSALSPGQAAEQPLLAVMPGRRVHPGAVSLWAQQTANGGGRPQGVPDMPGVPQLRLSGGGGSQAPSGLPPGWESRVDAVRLAFGGFFALSYIRSA